MSIPNYDTEIEKMYHPENFENRDEDEAQEEDSVEERLSQEHLDKCSGCAECEP